MDRHYPLAPLSPRQPARQAIPHQPPPALRFPYVEPAVVDVQDEPATRTQQATDVSEEPATLLGPLHHAESAEQTRGLVKRRGGGHTAPRQPPRVRPGGPSGEGRPPPPPPLFRRRRGASLPTDRPRAPRSHAGRRAAAIGRCRSRGRSSGRVARSVPRRSAGR